MDTENTLTLEQPTTEEIPQWMMDAAKVAVDKLMELGGWYHFLQGHADAAPLYALVIKGVAEEFRRRMPTPAASAMTTFPLDPPPTV